MNCLSIQEQNEVYNTFWTSNPETEADKIREAAKHFTKQELLDNYVSVILWDAVNKLTRLHYEFFSKPREEAIEEIIDGMKVERSTCFHNMEMEYETPDNFKRISEERIYIGTSILDAPKEVDEIEQDNFIKILKQEVASKDEQIHQLHQIIENLVKK